MPSRIRNNQYTANAMRTAFRIFAALVLLMGFSFSGPPAHACMTLTGAGGACGGGGFTPSCSQSTTWLARTSGLSATERNAYDTMICGMVTDSVWCGTLIDALYIFATNTTTTANLNLCSASFGLTQTGAVTFSADNGYTGDGSTGFLDTGFTPSTASGNYALANASVGAYVLNNRTTSNASVSIGAVNISGPSFSYIQPLNTTFQYEILGAAFLTVANGSARGHWLATRTSGTTVTAYKNGTSFGSSGADTGQVLQNQTILIGALHDSGSIDDFSSDQIAAAYYGAGANATQASNIDKWINGYMTALGINVH